MPSAILVPDIEQTVPSTISCFHTFMTVLMVHTASTATACIMITSDRYHGPWTKMAGKCDFGQFCPSKKI